MTNTADTRSIIIHLGMNKTGASSIQKAFRDYDDGRMRYLQLGMPNHSKALSTVFSQAPERHSAYQARGYSKSDVDVEKNRFLKRLSTELAYERERFVTSAEGLLDLSLNEIAALKTFLDERKLKPRFVAYVREPRSYTSLVFQQEVRQGLGEFSVSRLRYRALFEKFIELFGRDAIEFAHFESEQLEDGSVVTDFVNRIGADPGHLADAQAAAEPEAAADSTAEATDTDAPAAQAPKDRQSPGPEAIALLYFWNRESNAGQGSKAIIKGRRNVIDALAELYPGRFTLGKATLDAALDADDIAWMETTGGFSLLANPREKKAQSVDSESDLAHLRERSVEGVAALLRERGLDEPKDAGSSYLLDKLLTTLMPETPKPAPLTPEMRLAQSVAKAIWKVQTDKGKTEGAPGDVTDERIADARRIIKKLKTNGVSLNFRAA
ncbi:MAG: hypothetical protein AcusKO_07390 [Acuticoccus sp.]